MILIDSDILIWILRNDAGYKERFADAVRESEGYMYITPIQYAEILAGVREREKIDTEIFLDSLETVSIDNEIGRIAGEYVRRYKKSHGVFVADALIAATAKVNSCTLWTNNRKHFPMLQADDFYA